MGGMEGGWVTKRSEDFEQEGRRTIKTGNKAISSRTRRGIYDGTDSSGGA